MDQLAAQLGAAEIQALIAALPTDLTINANATKPNSASSSDLSAANSASCIFPPLSDLQALSMLSLGAYPLLPGFPLLSLPYLNIPGINTIENLGLINSALYQSQKEVQAALSAPSVAAALAADVRPRAFSSAATLQNVKDQQEKRRKRTRKCDPVMPPTTSTITCSANTSPSTSAPVQTSVLRSLVEDDEPDVHPNKVRPIQVVTPEEEELVRRKTQELIRAIPRQEAQPEVSPNGPLRRLIRDEDLPDEVGPDSPFRHYPKYQQKPRSQLIMLQGIQAAVACMCIEAFQLNDKTEEEKAALRQNQQGLSLDDLVKETVRQELIAAE
ncbi:hypothetical protein CAEBREN_06543 [Caenorhabditis brenneri]|uniref:Uncharacterized protein n=1 Tax=Caenorhabditis brenneri TaxID=135651 RepID=G0PKZ5_CAEBE|nr:hypothetical protein CAEBREN_06543 [Caenorhabditis brenneri]